MDVYICKTQQILGNCDLEGVLSLLNCSMRGFIDSQNDYGQ